MGFERAATIGRFILLLLLQAGVATYNRKLVLKLLPYFFLLVKDNSKMYMLSQGRKETIALNNSFNI